VKPEYGSEVIDHNGQILGTVDHLIRNLNTGEIRKFMVPRKSPEKDLFLSPEDILEATNDTVKMSVTLEEIRQ